MKLKLILLTFLVFVFGFSNVSAYEDKGKEVFIGGTVLSKSTKKPLENYKVQVVTNYGAVVGFTNKEGKFILKPEVPTKIDRTKQEYFFSIKIGLSNGVLIKNDKNEFKIFYDEKEGYIKSFEGLQEKTEYVILNKEKTEVSSVIPSGKSFIKIFLIIFGFSLMLYVVSHGNPQKTIQPIKN